MEKLTQRQIRGAFYHALETVAIEPWIDAISNYFTSDQKSEEYAWLGATPRMREWLGGRYATGLLESSITIINKLYEATIKVEASDLRRDKSGQTLGRIAELAKTAKNDHWMEVLSQLIVDAASTACYDGQFFFDTDHSEGDSGTQDNDISVDISEVAASVHGSTTAPSVEEMDAAITQGVAQICKFKDDRARPMNMTARQFVAMTPVSLFPAAAQACNVYQPAGYPQNVVSGLSSTFRITPVPNPWLDANSWTDAFCIFRTDGFAKAFIRQEEYAPKLAEKGYGSEYEFDNNAHQYGVDSSRNAGYGFWQMACLVTLA